MRTWMLLLFSLLAGSGIAGPRERQVTDKSPVVAPAPLLFGDSGGVAKAEVDTVFLLGGPDRWDGRFETPAGQPDWHGWTHHDLSAPDANHWQRSTYQAANLNGHGEGNHAWWCGEDFAPCDDDDEPGGYGDRYLDSLIWQRAAPDPAQPVEVRITAYVNADLVDAGWDFLYLDVFTAGGWERLQTWTGSHANVFANHTVVLQPADLGGATGDQILIRWLVRTDWGWSDEDCQSPSHGACQIDDIAVYLDGDLVTFNDCEPGTEVNWSPEAVIGVGDFAQLRNNLGDLDVCRDNRTWQVTFIDDGLVVPGTGGTPCQSWCYGPDGWVLNPRGGLLASDPQQFFLENLVVSPPIAWPDGLESARLDFGVYRHETFCAQCAGIFHAWHVRSTASEDPADLAAAPWRDRGFVFYGGPDYHRQQEPVGDLLVPGRRWVQIALEVNEAGWMWGVDSEDATPAPAFDNVALRAWSHATAGPQIVVNESRLFQDAFPEQGVVNPADPAANWCRLDMAADVYVWDGSADPGDSLVVDVTPLRDGAALVAPPRLHWMQRCNPLFDDVRLALPGPDGLARGSVLGDSSRTSQGQVVAGRWYFDLPDTGFFYPGDRLHYYVTAEDLAAGVVQTSVWPADTTSALDFSALTSYPEQAQVRALPSLDLTWQQPSLLFWDNQTSRAMRWRWLRSLGELGLHDGADFDAYTSRRGGDQGQNLGNRCTPAQLGAYATLVVAAARGINGPSNNADDQGLLLDWLDLGARRLLLAGDNVESGSGAAALFNRLGVNAVNRDLGAVVGGSRDFRLASADGGLVVPEGATWRIDDGCPDLALIDALVLGNGAWAAATFTRSGGEDLGYPAIAAREEVALDNRLLVLPFDLQHVQGDGTDQPPGEPALAPRTRLLQHLLAWLGTTGGAPVVGVPDGHVLGLSAHPNPFNPRTVISLDLPQTGEVDLAIYDVQGRLVRRLIQATRTAGRHQEVWDGKDDRGRAAASGLYFYRLQALGEQRLGKVTMLR